MTMLGRGLEAGEYKRVNSFLSYEDIKVKNEQLKKINIEKNIEIDTSIAGGYDPTVGKDRYYQLDCINTLIEKYREGKEKMLVHMATGLGKTTVSEATAYLMKTKATLKNYLLIDKLEFDKNNITKAVLNETIERIVIKDERTATVYFKSGLIMEKDFIKTIE